MPPTTQQPHCTFCRIVEGLNPHAIVYRDAQAMAFMDVNPVTRGHTLVIPVEHWADLYCMPDDVCTALMLTSRRVARAVKAAFAADGVNLWMANERPAGQTVFHAHMHVIPRYRDDGMRLVAPGRVHSDPSRLEDTAARIRDALEGLSHG